MFSLLFLEKKSLLSCSAESEANLQHSRWCFICSMGKGAVGASVKKAYNTKSREVFLKNIFLVDAKELPASRVILVIVH